MLKQAHEGVLTAVMIKPNSRRILGITIFV